MNLSRRNIIKVSLSLFSLGLLFPGCGNNNQDEDPCGDLSKVSENDLKVRKKMAYVDEAPNKNKTCSNCNLFLPSSDASCGKCLLFKGPVKSNGTCAYWAPKM
ncbi:MAG: high-potential iron-sulfur protein [Chitinophagaceae bacterium]|nr:high-potential iron-sulfur protein [Chitinophagaceae bacterium]